MAGPTVVEQPKPITITGEHLKADAGMVDTGDPLTEVTSFRDALNKQGGARVAERALRVVQREKKASYDGRDPAPIAENIRDGKTKQNAIDAMRNAQSTMAAVDILRIKDPLAQETLFRKLQADGKIDSKIADVQALIDQTSGQVVNSAYFQEWYKQNGYPPGDEADFAYNFFLAGPMADTVRAVASEEVGLLRGKIAELPAVQSSKREELDAAQKTADAIKKGAAAEIQSQSEAIIVNAGGEKTAIDATVQSAIIAAAGIENNAMRIVKLSDVLAKTAGMSPTEISDIHTYEANRNELTRLKTDATKNAKRITILEHLVTGFEGDAAKQDLLLKYQSIQTQVQSTEIQQLTNTYVENTKIEMNKRLELLGTGSATTTTSKDELARQNAEQNLDKDISGMMDRVLATAVKERIDFLSNGAQLAAADAIEDAQKKGETEEALMFAKYRGSLAGGKEGIFERRVTNKTGKNGKVESATTEVLHVDNLEVTLSVMAANDTALGADGTRFMMAYRAGLFNESAVNKNLAKLVIKGELSAAEALTRLDGKGQQLLGKLCTEEHMSEYRKHVFAEFARAQDYIHAGGMFQDGGKVAQFMRKMKGIEIKIEGGDPAKLGKLTMHWDRIMQTHAAEVEAAIDASQDAKALRDKLKAEGWISGDRKRKNLLYLIMMLTGLVAFPALGLPLGITGAGAGIASLAGGAAGKGLADKVVGFSQN